MNVHVKPPHFRHQVGLIGFDLQAYPVFYMSGLAGYLDHTEIVVGESPHPHHLQLNPT